MSYCEFVTVASDGVTGVVKGGTSVTVIVIIVLVISVCTIIAVVCLYRRRRRRKKTNVITDKNANEMNTMIRYRTENQSMCSS